MGFKQTNPRIGYGDRGIRLDLEAKMVGGGGGFNFLWWWSCWLDVVTGVHRGSHEGGHMVALVGWSRTVQLGAAHGCLGWLSMEAQRWLSQG